MKKILIVMIIIPILAFANLNIQKVTNTLSHLKGNKQVSFFNANKHIPLNGKIKLTTLRGADIVLFSHKKHKSKITIVNSYKKLKSNKNSIGAIYMKKGRTQIIFIKERLDKHRLTLSSKFRKHILNEQQLKPKSLMSNLK